MIPAWARTLSADRDWADKAYCAGADTELFFDPPSQGFHTIRKYCHHCPVIRECLEYAKVTHSVGVWGGQLLGPSLSNFHQQTPEQAAEMQEKLIRMHLEGKKSVHISRELRISEPGVRAMIFRYKAGDYATCLICGAQFLQSSHNKKCCSSTCTTARQKQYASPSRL